MIARRAAPLQPPIPVDRALPWKLVPARLFLHAGIFTGVCLSVLDATLGGGTLDHMSWWTYIVWVIFGLAGLPLIAGAYIAVAAGNGATRYFALRMELLANVLGLFVLAEYGYSAVQLGYVFWRDDAALAWCLLAAWIAFLAWIVVNDLLRSRALEHRAVALQRNDDDSGATTRDGL